MVSEENSFNEVTNLFYDRIKNNLISVTLDNSTVVTIQNVTFAWPESEKVTKTDFPFIIISNEDANDTEEDIQYEYEEVTNTLTIYAASTNTEALSRILGKIYDLIKTNKETFREQGITKIKLIDKDNENDDMGGILVRKGYLTFEVKFRRSRF